MRRHTLITLYGDEGEMQPQWPPHTGLPAYKAVGPLGSRDDFERAADQMPRVLHHAEHSPNKLVLPPESDARGSRGTYTVTNVGTDLFLLPYGGLVLALVLTFEADDLGGTIQLLRDTSFRRRRIHLNECPLGDFVNKVVSDSHLPHTFVIGRVHQLFIDDDASCFRPPNRPILRSFSPWRLISSDLDRLYADLDLTRIYLLMNHDDEPYRVGNSWVRFPREANHEQRFFTALTPGTTVLAGHSRDIVNGMLLAAVQCVASADRAAWVRTQVYSTLRQSDDLEQRTSPGSLSDRRSELARLAQRLGRLELELSFGVEAYLDVGLVLSDDRIAAYQRELANTMALPQGASTISGLLDRLARTITGALAEVEKDERERDERRREHDERRAATWAWVTSAVAIVAVPATLTLAFLGINAREVQAGLSIRDPSYLPFYIALLAILLLAALVGWFVGRRRRSKDGAAIPRSSRT
jgi:hypothetical protein